MLGVTRSKLPVFIVLSGRRDSQTTVAAPHTWGFDLEHYCCLLLGSTLDVYNVPCNQLHWLRDKINYLKAREDWTWLWKVQVLKEMMLKVQLVFLSANLWGMVSTIVLVCRTSCQGFPQRDKLVFKKVAVLPRTGRECCINIVWSIFKYTMQYSWKVLGLEMRDVVWERPFSIPLQFSRIIKEWLCF